MVGSSGITAAASPPSSRTRRVPQGPDYDRATPTGIGTGEALSIPDLPPRPSTTHTDRSRGSGRTVRGGYRDFHRRSRSTSSSLTGSSRSSSFDLGLPSASATTPTTGKSTPVLNVRPELRVNSDAGQQIASVSSSGQRRWQQGPVGNNSEASSSITTPLTGTSDAASFWRVTAERQRALTNVGASPSSEPPVLPDLNLQQADSDDLSKIPGLTPTSPVKQTFKLPSSPSHQAASDLKDSRRPKYRKEHHRTQSQKAMLANALQKANTAVTLDRAENYEGAMEAYEDACVLLSQVMIRAGAEEDKKKLQTIKETYMERIDELKAIPPRSHENERELPPRPSTEEFTDEGSLYTVGDDESGHTGSTNKTIQINGSQGAVAVPPRRDSLFVAQESLLPADPLPPVPMVQHTGVNDRTVPASFSPSRRRPSSPRENALETTNLEPPNLRSFIENNRDSFTFGAAALSPRYTSKKASVYGIQRRSSDASSVSSHRHSIHMHSREASGGGEVSTSWINFGGVDESGSSASGEFSPGFTRKLAPTRLDPIEQEQDKDRGFDFDDDFDTQLDAAVEAAYDDGYEVDYSFDKEDELIKDELMTEELMMMQSPRLNVERAKERVRQVEREMEMEIQKEKERRMERERAAFFKSNRESEIDFFDDGDEDESDEEERMLEEMTRGYTLDDFDFNLGTKTALPRESSSSTTYSDSTLPRGSVSSGYSSGTTWGSSFSGHMATSTTLQTVTELPSTPPPVPLPPVPQEGSLGIDEDEVSPTTRTPASALQPGLALSKAAGIRGRRLSALSESLEPLKIETTKATPVSTSNTAVPTTVIRGPSPRMENESLEAPPSAPAKLPPPVPSVPPLAIPPRSTSTALPSRPGTASGVKDVSIPESPEDEKPVSIGGRKLSSPTPPNAEVQYGGLSAVPLTKAISDDGSSASRSGSPARFPPRLPALRQIHSSASLRSRTVSPEEGSNPGSNLYASSSTSNLRKAIPRSGTPSTPSIIPMTPMGGPPPTAGLPTNGMNLFDNKFHTPETPNGSMDTFSAMNPYPLEPCPPDTLSKPYWLMRSLYQTITHPKGGYISTKLFVPREVWSMKGVKLKSLDDKISACDLVTAALEKLARVQQNDINTVFEEMQSLEGVLDRAQTVLSKKLGNEVGGSGAKGLYQNENSPAEAGSDMVTTKTGNVGGGKSYFSLRKLRTKTSNNALGANFASNASAESSFPMAASSSENPQQPKRDISQVIFTGPHSAYTSSLAKLFDSAQILDRLPHFDEDSESKKTPITIRVGLELSQRHAAEFFGFYICRFVLTDVALLLDKFVKRGTEWVAA